MVKKNISDITERESKKRKETNKFDTPRNMAEMKDYIKEMEIENNE